MLKVRIRDLLDSSVPGDWGTEATEDDGIPVLRSTNFRSDGGIDFEDVAFRHINPLRLEVRRVNKGTVLVEKSGGSPTQAAGRVAYCNREFNGTASNFIEVIKVKETYDSRFVGYLLHHLYQLGLVNKYQQQTTGIINFKWDQYVQETVSCPASKDEQSEISELLSTVDRAIDVSSSLIAKQQRIRTGLMQDLLSRGIDEQGKIRSEETHRFKDTALGRFPEEWNTSLLDSLAVRGSGHTPNRLRPEYWNGGIDWVSLADSQKLGHVVIEETENQI